MAANVTQFLYNFHWERDYSLSAFRTFQTSYLFFSLFTWHPLVLYMLIYHPGPLSKEIRAGYIANQICLMLNEWVFSGLVRVYPLMPYPALFCDGPLCQLGLPQQAVTTILAAFVILPNPPFEFLLLCMHQKMVANTPSRTRFSQRTQTLMMYTLVVLLILNVVGFCLFGTPSERIDEISNRPELAWLKAKGQLLVFGDVGSAEYFVYECYFLGATLLLVFPVVVFLSVHATLIIHQAKSMTTDRTARLQNRIMSVILIQLHSVFLFYILPLTVMILTIIFPSNEIFQGIGRPTLTACFIMNPMPLSLVFLLKNTVHREIIRNKFNEAVHYVFNRCLPSPTVVANQRQAFSNHPSTSITRSVVI